MPASSRRGSASPPLVDDFPYRLPPRETGAPDEAFWRVMDVEATRPRFQESAWIARTWTAAVRHATLARFAEQGVLNRLRVAGNTSFSLRARQKKKPRWQCHRG